MTDPSDQTPRPPETAEFGHVVSGGSAHEYPAAGELRVVKLSVGPYDNNVYLISSGGQALIVDGAADAERILGEVASRGLTVTAIVETHGHMDHVQALADLVRALGVPVLANPGDRWPVPTEPLADGRSLTVGDTQVRAIHSPGHTPGSTCFAVPGFLFSGDALFPGGPGKTENAAAFRQAMTSLDGLFGELADETRICPGHGLDSTIGRERPQVEVWRARGW
jgi:glyoxylase-like metal-dependent hydrolase (beta-lactamase superfamily II)